MHTHNARYSISKNRNFFFFLLLSFCQCLRSRACTRCQRTGQCLRSRACPRCQRTDQCSLSYASRCEQVNVQLRSRACTRCQRTVLSGQCLHRMSMQEQYSVLSGHWMFTPYAYASLPEMSKNSTFYVRGLAWEVKEQNLVNVYARGLVREVRQRTALSGQCLRSRACPRCEQVNVQLRSRACPRCSTFWSMFTPYVYARTVLSTFWSMFTPYV